MVKGTGWVCVNMGKVGGWWVVGWVGVCGGDRVCPIKDLSYPYIRITPFL